MKMHSQNLIPYNSISFYSLLFEQIQKLKKGIQATEKLGVNQDEIDELLNYVKSLSAKGKRLSIRRVGKSEVYVNNKLFKFSNGLNGVDSFADSLATNSGDPTAMIISQLVDFDKVIGNFSAVFSNGFNLSCWGSSMNPSDQKKKVELVTAKIKQLFSQMNEYNIEETLNQAEQHMTYEYSSHERTNKRKKLAKCTRQAIELHTKSIRDLKAKTLDTLIISLRKKGYKITVTQQSLNEQILEDRFRPNPDRSNTTAEKNQAMFGNIKFNHYTVAAPESTINNNALVNSFDNAKPTVQKVGFKGVAFMTGLAFLLLFRSSPEKSNN